MAWALPKEGKIWGFPVVKLCANSEDKDADQQGQGLPGHQDLGLKRLWGGRRMLGLLFRATARGFFCKSVQMRLFQFPKQPLS